MNHLKRFALALLVSALAAAAHADGTRGSLFHCGIQLGGGSKPQKAYSAPKKSEGYGPGPEVKPTDSSGPAVTTFTGAPANTTGRRRMPPAFTIANFGCSWR
jgi:hypothetical protein